MRVSIHSTRIAPTGLHSLNSSTVTAIAGESFTLSWLAFDVDTLPSVSAVESGAPIAISGSLREREPWAECLEPQSNSQINLNRPELVQYVSSSVNIEEAGTYSLSANQTLPSSVQVEGKHAVCMAKFERFWRKKLKAPQRMVIVQ